MIRDTIKELRKTYKLTQNEMAELLLCNRQKIADWERGKSLPSADDLILLSEKFHVSSDYLLGLSSAPTNDLDEQNACDYTGLSLESMQRLNSFSTLSEIPQRKIIEVINFLLSENEWSNFFNLCMKINEIKGSIKSLNSFYENELDNIDLSTLDDKRIRELITSQNTLTNNLDINEYRLSKLLNVIVHDYSKKQRDKLDEYKKKYENTITELKVQLITLQTMEREQNAES